MQGSSPRSGHAGVRFLRDAGSHGQFPGHRGSSNKNARPRPGMASSPTSPAWTARSAIGCIGKLDHAIGAAGANLDTTPFTPRRGVPDKSPHRQTRPSSCRGVRMPRGERATHAGSGWFRAGQRAVGKRFARQIGRHWQWDQPGLRDGCSAVRRTSLRRGKKEGSAACDQGDQ